MPALAMGVVVAAPYVEAAACVTAGFVVDVIANDAIQRFDGPHTPDGQKQAHGVTDKGDKWAINQDGFDHHGSAQPNTSSQEVKESPMNEATCSSPRFISTGNFFNT